MERLPDRPVRLVQLTDPHLGEHEGERLRGFDADRHWRAALEHAAGALAEADGVLVTGDLVNDAGDGAYARIRRLEAFTAAPVRVIPGNHDDAERMQALFAEGQTRMAPELKLGDWAIFLLDSAIPGRTEGRIDSAELARLEELARLSRQPHRLVVLHHHPVALGSAWLDALGLENGEALFAALQGDSGVRGVLWGHTHQASDMHYGPIRLLGTPATSAQFARGSERFALDRRLPGYRLLALHPDGAIETSVRRFHPWVRTLVSGGQTGVDRAALEVAEALGIEHGGWCPAGRRAEDGRIPDRFRLVETERADYRQRTRRNVEDSDATLILARGELRGGTRLTARIAEAVGRPLLSLDLDGPVARERFEAWLETHAVRRLNVAGPRESGEPGIQADAAACLTGLLTGVDAHGRPIGRGRSTRD